MEPRSYLDSDEYKLNEEHLILVNQIYKKNNKYYFDLYTP